MTEKLRWRIADLMDRLPGQCWADLASWALYGPRKVARDGESRLPWRPITAMCRRDAAENDQLRLCRAPHRW
jgi:hypothetical protein